MKIIKNERDPPLFTGKLLIKFQNILRNILFSVISSPTRMNCFRYLKLMSPLNATICTTSYLERQKCYGPGKKILFKKQLFDLEVKVPQRSLRYVTHHLMVMHPHTKYHWPISNDKTVMTRTRKYYLKNNYLTLRSKVKVSRRTLWYATHCVMVMHQHTKYNWPIWKDKKVMVRTSKRRGSGRRKNQNKKQYISLRSKGRPNKQEIS